MVCVFTLTRTISYPDNIPHRQFPTQTVSHPDNIQPRQYPTQTISHPDSISPRQYPTQTISHPDNIPPRQFSTQTVSHPDNIPHRQFPTQKISLKDDHLLHPPCPISMREAKSWRPMKQEKREILVNFTDFHHGCFYDFNFSADFHYTGNRKNIFQFSFSPLFTPEHTEKRQLSS